MKSTCSPSKEDQYVIRDKESQSFHKGRKSRRIYIQPDPTEIGDYRMSTSLRSTTMGTNCMKMSYKAAENPKKREEHSFDDSSEPKLGKRYWGKKQTMIWSDPFLNYDSKSGAIKARVRTFKTKASLNMILSADSGIFIPEDKPGPVACANRR